MKEFRHSVNRLVSAAGLALCCSGRASDGSAILYGQVARSVLGGVQSIPGVNAPALAPAMQVGYGLLDAWTAQVLARNLATPHQQTMAEAKATQYYGQLPPQQRAAVGRKLAVDAPPAPGVPGKSVMLYDTQTGRTTGTIYAVKGVPARGQTMVIDSARATYIGSGSVMDTYY